jgi:SAM-dependent methyltransferase
MVERHLALFHGDLLDIGCGEKPYEDLLLPRVSSYVGLDHLDTQHSGSRVDVWGDAAALPFGDNEFDTIAAFQVLEHVPEPSKVLVEAYRVLRPGGGIYISTPFMWGLHELPHDYFRYAPAGLHHLVSQAGFIGINVIPVSGYWLMAGLRFSYYVRRFARGPLETLLAPLMSLVQCIALALDFLDHVESDSIGYVTTAAKPLELV